MYHKILFLLAIVTCIDAQQNFGKITLPLGKVELSTEAGKWTKAKPNHPVSEGNIIRTHARSSFL